VTKAYPGSEPATWLDERSQPLPRRLGVHFEMPAAGSLGWCTLAPEPVASADSGLPVFIRTALKDRKRTTELTHGFESNLGETNVARSFSMQSDKGLDRWRQISEGN
jgi:hypothetical protein